MVNELSENVQLTDEQRLDWLRLIRSQNIGPRGIMAQTPEARGVCAIIPGPRTFRALVNHFGGARAALEALPSLARRGGASTATKICSQADAERDLPLPKAWRRLRRIG